MGNAFSQVNPTIQEADEAEEKIEQVAQEVAETVDLEPLFQKLIHFRRNPININTATRTDLQDLLFFNEFQIQALLQQLLAAMLMLEMMGIIYLEQYLVTCAWIIAFCLSIACWILRICFINICSGRPRRNFCTPIAIGVGSDCLRISIGICYSNI